jgi:hypothetical protein
MADRVWTAQDVADRFREAAMTLRRLPPVKVQGHFNLWPAIRRCAEEMAQMEPRPMRITPSPAAISRLEETMDWVLWISEEERHLVWARAARVPWKRLCWQLGCDRTTAWRRWQRALWTIAARLNAARR